MVARHLRAYWGHTGHPTRTSRSTLQTLGHDTLVRYASHNASRPISLLKISTSYLAMLLWLLLTLKYIFQREWTPDHTRERRDPLVTPVTLPVGFSHTTDCSNRCAMLSADFGRVGSSIDVNTRALDNKQLYFPVSALRSELDHVLKVGSILLVCVLQNARSRITHMGCG
jgi:hypothetical protein